MNAAKNQPGATWLGRWRLDRLAIKREKKKDKEQRKQKRASARNWSWIVTRAVIVVSISAAAPFQFLYFWGVFADQGGAPTPVAIAGAAIITLVVEGMAWHGAVYYFQTAGTSIGRLYRGETFLFAGIAAAANFTHGVQEYNVIVGAAFAIASLMGVGAWELHMLRTKQIRTGMTAEEIKLWASRRWRHRKVFAEAKRVRAVFGLQVPMETAWRMAYVRRNGAPTVPVPTTDEIVSALLGNTSSEPAKDAPSSGSETTEDTSTGTSSSGVSVLEVPVDWSQAQNLGDLMERFWPELSERSGSVPETTDAERTAELPAVPPSAARSVPGRPKRNTEDVTTSGKDRSARNDERNGTPERNTGQRPRLSEAERNGTEPVKTRIRNYIARQQRKGTEPEQLDRKFIEEQFGVTGRYVREAFKEHREAKTETN